MALCTAVDCNSQSTHSKHKVVTVLAVNLTHGTVTIYASLSVCWYEAIEDLASPHQVVRLCAMLSSCNLHNGVSHAHVYMCTYQSVCDITDSQQQTCNQQSAISWWCMQMHFSACFVSFSLHVSVWCVCAGVHILCCMCSLCSSCVMSII